MALARWQATIVDDEGNVQPLASVEVRAEVAGAPLVPIFSDREGAVPLANPFTADSEGFAFFHAIGGSYKITATKGAFTTGDRWRYVGVGTGSETDFGNIFTPQGVWVGGSPPESYQQGDVVSHSVTGSGDFAFLSNVNGNAGNEPSFVGSPPEPQSNEFWTVLGVSVSGTKGDTGETGAPGSSNVVGTSATNIEISEGAKAFTIVEDDRGWGVGARLRASSDANPTTHYMEGVVTSYSANTLNITIDLVSDTGSPPDSRADWTINVAGVRGQAGAGNVDSVNGQDGTVVLGAADISFAQPSPPLDNTDATDVQEAIEDLDSALSIWAMQPIGVPIPVWDHLTGVEAPPNDPAGPCYILLTAGEDGVGEHNENLLDNESVSGSAPDVVATADINLAASPLNNQSVRLVNSTGEFLRPSGTSGTVQADGAPNITGTFGNDRWRAANNFNVSGAFSASNAGANEGVTPSTATSTLFSFDASDSDATYGSSNDVRPRNVGATYYMRIL